jgi:competence protein ComEC
MSDVRDHPARRSGRAAVAAIPARAGPRAATGGHWRRIAAAFDPAAAARGEADGRRLFLWLPVALGAGIALCFQADGTPSFWPPAGLAAALGLIAWRMRDRLSWFAALVGCAAVAAGFASAVWRMAGAAAPILDRPAVVRLAGFVEAVDAGPAGGRMVLRLTAAESAAPATMPERVRATFRGAPPRAGDHVSGRARLMPPPQPAYPGGYDFARDAYFLGLGAVGRWIGPIALSAPPEPMPLRLRLTVLIDNARTDLTNRIAGLIGGQPGALSAALVTGKRGLLDEASNEAMRAAGIYHVVSISGLHMVLAAGVFFWLARAALALLPGVAETRPIKKWAALVAMAGASAYCVFSGSEVATERSLVMTLVMLGAILVDRPALSMRNLAISAIIVLLREPETMLGPSFQMSFAAVAGMIAANDWWLSRRPAKAEPSGWSAPLLRRLWFLIAANLATTLIASLATAPFAAFHFQRLNPYGLVGNALAVPFVSLVVMPAAVAGTLLLPFGLDGPVWTIMGAGSARVLEVARYVAEFQGSVRGLTAFGTGALLLMSLGFVVLVLLRTPLRLTGAALIAAGAAVAAAPSRPDLLIDREGRHLMFRGDDGRLALLGKGGARFTTERWLQSDGDLRRAGDPTLRLGSRCDRLGCVAQLPGGAVALVLDIEAFEEDCARAKLVVTPFEAPAYCRASARVIDRTDLARSSSLAVTLFPGGYALTPARPADRWKPWYGRPRGPAPAADGAAPTSPPPDRGANPDAHAREDEPDTGSDLGADLFAP